MEFEAKFVTEPIVYCIGGMELYEDKVLKMMEWVRSRAPACVPDELASQYFVCSVAFVASKIWTWYFVPLGFQAYNWTTFAGVALLLRLARTKVSFEKSNDETETAKIVGSIVACLTIPWVTLLIAWWLR